MASPKVLVADDSATIRTMVRRTLESAGLDVVCVSDGIEAVERLREQPPNLAILDINMPGLDGYAVCDQLRSMGPSWARVPIIFLTSDRSNALQLLGQKFGAYLPKPIHPDQLIATVSQFVPVLAKPQPMASSS
jgi:CheY-like chemotaxis protein